MPAQSAPRPRRRVALTAVAAALSVAPTLVVSATGAAAASPDVSAASGSCALLLQVAGLDEGAHSAEGTVTAVATDTVGPAGAMPVPVEAGEVLQLALGADAVPDDDPSVSVALSIDGVAQEETVVTGPGCASAPEESAAAPSLAEAVSPTAETPLNPVGDATASPAVEQTSSLAVDAAEATPSAAVAGPSAPGGSTVVGAGEAEAGQSDAASTPVAVAPAGGAVDPELTDLEPTQPGAPDPEPTDQEPTQPGATGAAPTDPAPAGPVSSDPATGPAVGEPAGNAPAGGEPAADTPAPTDPTGGDAATTDQGATDPGTSDPGTSDPATGPPATGWLEPTVGYGAVGGLLVVTSPGSTSPIAGSPPAVPAPVIASPEGGTAPQTADAGGTPTSEVVELTAAASSDGGVTAPALTALPDLAPAGVLLAVLLGGLLMARPQLALPARPPRPAGRRRTCGPTVSAPAPPPAAPAPPRGHR